MSLLAVIVADMFGPHTIAMNFGAIYSAAIFGSYLFATGIVAIFHHTNTTDDKGDKACIGAGCFRMPFVINSLCCFFMVFLVLYMHVRTPMPKINKIRRARGTGSL